MTIALAAAAMVAAFLMLESVVRLYRWRLAPARLRLMHAAFLLPDEVVEAVSEIHQRVERVGGRSFAELFALYAEASGLDRVDIEQLFGFRMSWRRLLTCRLVLRHHLRWHVGLVPMPHQCLRTATIDGNGTRSSGGFEIKTAAQPATVKQVALLGGSVAFGYGATSDEATVAGRLSHYLNRQEPRPGQRWEVVNRAFPGATSFQELIVALQSDDVVPPAYIISLSGCNDVDQQFGCAQANVSALAQGYTNSLQKPGGIIQAVVRAGRQRFAVVAATARFVNAYRRWPGPARVVSTGRALPTGSTAPDIDRPDIYPLW